MTGPRVRSDSYSFEVIRLLRFRPLMLCILALVLSFVLPAYAADAGNLVVNGGFEQLDDDGLPTGWYTEAYLNREGISLYSMTGDAHTGENAAVVENCDMNDARFAQRIMVEPNTMYRLSGWVWAEGNEDVGRGANLSIEGMHRFSESVYDTAGEWYYVEYYGETGDDQHELTIFVRLGGYSGESIGRAAFDDIELVAVEELPVGVYAEPWYSVQAPVQIAPISDADAGVAKPFWPWLLGLSAAYTIAALATLRHCQLDRRTEALREAGDRCGRFRAGMPGFALAGMGLAALVRIIIALKVEGYQVDVNCFTAWGNTMRSVGPAMFYQSNWCDYTPGYIYVMGLNGAIANALGGLVSASFVHKLIPMACDLAAAWICYRVAADNGCTRKQGSLLALILAFNPALILNSAAWCQIDAVLCLGLVLVAYLAIQRKWAAVLPVYVVCILVKPQALMLGFLGLAAIVMELVKAPVKREMPAAKWRSTGSKLSIWYRSLRFPKIWKQMGLGLVLSLAAAMVIILPFSPNQESAAWLIDLYTKTLGSYPYATVNTANIYYLFGGNWDAIANPAHPGVAIVLSVCCLVWAVYTLLEGHVSRENRTFSAIRTSMLQQLRWRMLAEPLLMLVYAVTFLLLAIIGTSWTILGIVAMSLAFAVVLPMYVRSGKLENLPLCGAVIFLLLYVFGIKMHERYLFPAIFLLGMAYAIRRDRRILLLLIGTSCALFVNEGIVLDNSIRLGSAMGHLNNDTKRLADVLSLLNIAFTLMSVFVCRRVCVAEVPARLDEALGKPVLPIDQYQQTPCTPLNFKQDAALKLTRKDALLMIVVTCIYAVVTLTTLGSAKAPQTAWKSSTLDEAVYIDLGQHYDDVCMLYFCQVSYNNFTVAVSETGEDGDWSEEYWCEMNQGECFRWKYMHTTTDNDDTPTFPMGKTSANIRRFSGRFVRLTAQQIGLTINELIFKDGQGNIIPAMVMGAVNGNEGSPLYSSPENLLDEQDTLEGEPGWWNSTYFDEIYHARTGFEHLNGTAPYETSHPPLGKVIMSWFIAIFGMTPFGWRFAGALCGILMLPAMYMLVKQLFKRTDLAFIGMMLMTLDCMHFTQTRIATIDSYPVLFIILSYFFMLRFMQRDIVLAEMKTLLPDLALSGFFMGCGFASKWIGAYAGVGLAVLYFWTCLRHMRLQHEAIALQRDASAVFNREEREILDIRENSTKKRIVFLCLWCLLFFVAIPLTIYLLSYIPYFAYREFSSLWEYMKTVYEANFVGQYSMLGYHSTPGMGMDHPFYSPWYEWPLMMRPMYYSSPAYTPDGWSYALFCFGNPWVWVGGIVGIAYTLYRWAIRHRYALQGEDASIRLYSSSWDVTPAFILIGLLAQFLPWVLVPRGTYIYHYFASIPFLILGIVLMIQRLTDRWPKQGKTGWVTYLALCLVWFVLLFPYASGLLAPEWWMDFIQDYPYLNKIPNYWQNSFLYNLNLFLEKIPIFPHVYH